MPRLFTALALARGDGRYGKLMTAIARAKLLILDDWGPETLSPEQARDLLDRLIHNAHRLAMTGESMRKIAGKRSLDASRNP